MARLLLALTSVDGDLRTSETHREIRAGRAAAVLPAPGPAAPWPAATLENSAQPAQRRVHLELELHVGAVMQHRTRRAAQHQQHHRRPEQPRGRRARCESLHQSPQAPPGRPAPERQTSGIICHASSSWPMSISSAAVPTRPNGRIPSSRRRSVASAVAGSPASSCFRLSRSGPHGDARAITTDDDGRERR